MIKILTFKRATILAVLVLSFMSFASFSYGQGYYIRILNAPDPSIIGTEVLIAEPAWYSFCVDGIPAGTFTYQVANPYLAGPGAVDPLNGNVGLCKRGGNIAFVDKAKNIQNAGGIGMIIVNNVSGVLDNFGAEDPSITIWGAMVSVDYEQMFLNNVGMEYEFFQKAIIDSETAFWGNLPGQGDFDGGFNGWTTVSGCANNLGNWHWSYDGVNSGAYGGGSVVSPSGCNGAAYFQSDSMDNGGVAGAFGLGPCAAPQRVSLVSPIIDLSGAPAGTKFSLTFWNASRQFQSTYWVAWSSDAGATWDSTEVNSHLVVNAGSFTEKLRVPMRTLAGTDEVRVRFTYDANYYWWAIDDVKIVEIEKNNIKLSTDWISGPIYPMNAKHETTPNYFMTDIHNTGALEATDVKLTVDVIDVSNNNNVYTHTYNYGSIGSGDTVQNVVMNNLNPFNTPTTPGTYTIKYTVTMDSTDFNMGDNVHEIPFIVTDNLWQGRDNGPTNVISLAQTVRRNWLYSTNYREEDQNIASKNLVIDSVAVGFANSAEIAGATDTKPNIFIFEFPESALSDGLVSDAERTLVGYMDLPVDVSIPNNVIYTLPILDPNDSEKEITIEPRYGYQYTVGLYWQAPADNIELSAAWLANNTYRHTATEFIQYGTTPSITAYRPTSLVDPEFSLLDDLGYASNRSWFSGGGAVPVARIHYNTPLNKKDILPETSVKIYPTLATNNINVAFNFATSVNTKVEIVDLKGNIVKTDKFDNQTNQTNNISLNKLVPGNYLVKVSTKDGIITKQFTVID